ncbi:MAG: hypothetical protein IJW48_02270 [Clostridia bacterium]|nr:hypothetical protein [Clostridia bacterium]
MDGIEVFEHGGEGYLPAMSYDGWRVAFANYAERFDKEKFTYLERHLLTDEAFVLLSGEASLVIGRDLFEVRLERERIYNVKCGEWHALWLSRDAKVLIIENDGTGRENTEYYFLKR